MDSKDLVLSMPFLNNYIKKISLKKIMPNIVSLQKEVADGIVRSMAETFTFNKTEEGFKCVGLALPFNKTSRNGFQYIMDSVRETFQSLIGAPVLFNHNPDAVIGHVKNATVEADGMYYEIDLDPSEPIVQKINRGDVGKVSIQVMYDDKRSRYDDDSSTTFAWVTEFLELSVVTIPGFADTTMYVVESLKGKAQKKEKSTESVDLMSIAKEPAGAIDKDKWEQAKKAYIDSYGHEPATEDDWAIVASIYSKMGGPYSSQEEENTMNDEKPTPKPEDDMMVKYSEMCDTMKKMDERIAKLEQRLSEEVEEEPEKDKEPEKESFVDDDEKREEKIQANKQSVIAESVDSQPEPLTKQKLSEAFREAFYG